MISTILKSKVVSKPYQLFHFYFLSEKVTGSTLSNLNFSTNIRLSLNKFRNHHWTHAETAHYSFLTSVILFVYVIFPASIVIKTLILAAFAMCFLIPLTSQFFVHALPIFTWLALFFSAGKIPASWKPPISVKFLPAMETILYGDNLSNVLATFTNSTLDILAWLPYGLIHFSSPFVVAAMIFIFAPPTALRSFGFAFGYMNLLGVMTQILFPAAPPWYKNLYGLQPADYSMQGSPGGLARIDALLGVDMYTTTFSNSPVIFGAFPSLHAGCAVMDVLFLCYVFPRGRAVWWGYASILAWSTMYLTHHYFIDLIGGAVLSYMVFEYTKFTHLPVMDMTKWCRWSYTEINKFDVAASDPLSAYAIIATNDLESRYTDPSSVQFEMDMRSRSFSIPQRAHLPLDHDFTDDRVRVQDQMVLNADADGVDSSSLENSATPSVFDDEPTEEVQISTTTSTVSVDEDLYESRGKSKIR